MSNLMLGANASSQRDVRLQAHTRTKGARSVVNEGERSDSGGGGHASPAVVGDKLVWTLVRPEGTGLTDFQQYVVEELAEAVGALVPGTTQVRLTLQERHAFCGALVRMGDTDRRVDAVVQVISANPYVPTDPVNAVLTANCGHVQGWRVKPTTMDDASPGVALGKPSPFVQSLWMNQRIDGVTPEFYSRNWYIHGGHPDGREAETDESRANPRRWNPGGCSGGTSRTGCSNPLRRPPG